MKKILFAFAMLAFCLTSCDEITDVVNSIKVPDEAKPSKTFTLVEFSEEPHAADAHLFTTAQSNAPFSSIEFFGDGTYIMNTKGAARATVADEVGTYKVDGSLHYVLDNGASIDATGLDGAHGTISYTTRDGESASIVVTSDEPLTSLASKSFCRTWTLDTSKYWLSVKGITALYRGYTLENGVLKHEDNKVADFVGDIFEGDLMTLERWPETITISPFGTYFIRFASGKTLLQSWEWNNESKGTIKTASEAEFNIVDFLKNHDVTIRFENNSLKLYTEYDIQATRVLNANTFVPKTR